MIGIYGGTFDPIHLGHIHLLKELLKTDLFTKIILVPAKQNPLKPLPSQISTPMRVKLIETALEELGDSRINLWEGELKRSGLSFMKDTLQELQEKYREELGLILGNEVFADLPKWREPKQVLNLANIVVVQRTTSQINILSTLLQCGILDANEEDSLIRYAENSRWVKTIKINALPFSSTELRETLAKAWKTGDLTQVPQGIQRSVWLLIKENQLYAVS